MPSDYDQRIAALKAKRGKIDAKLNEIEQKAKADARKRDTRRKIIVGGAILAQIEKNPAFASMVRSVLAASVGRAQDREAISDLLNDAPIVTPAPQAEAAANS